MIPQINSTQRPTDLGWVPDWVDRNGCYMSFEGPTGNEPRTELHMLRGNRHQYVEAVPQIPPTRKSNGVGFVLAEYRHTHSSAELGWV